MRRRWLISFGAAVLVLAAAWLGLYMLTRQQPIPRRVLRQAGFGIWYPKLSTGYEVDDSSLKFSDQGDKIVTFVAKTRAGRRITITEQAVPESFTDVPQVYNKLVEKLRGYTTFDSVNGKVDLTRPEELKGGQTAVMQARGTLVFVQPGADLTTNDWRGLMNNLDFVH